MVPAGGSITVSGVQVAAHDTLEARSTSRNNITNKKELGVAAFQWCLDKKPGDLQAKVVAKVAMCCSPPMLPW